MPKLVALPEDTTPEELEQQRGSGHETCHIAFRTKNVEQEKRKSEENVPQEAWQSKRLKSVTNHELCVFSEEDSLSVYTTTAQRIQKRVCETWPRKWMIKTCLQR